MTDPNRRPLRILGLPPLTAVVVLAALAGTLLYLPTTDLPFEGHFDFGDRTRISWSDEEASYDLRIRGDVELDENVTGVARVSRDGYFKLRVEEDGERHRLDVTRGGDGELVYDYAVDRRRRSADEARAWLARRLPEIADRTGFGARKRALALLESQGVEAVFSHIASLRADVARSIYYRVLIERGELDSAGAERLVEDLAQRIESDYYKAETADEALDAWGPELLSGDSFFRMTTTLESDYYRAELLTSAARFDLAPEAAVAYLEALEGIESDHYRYESFKALAGRNSLTGAARAAAFRVALDFDSGYYLGGFLERLVEATPEEEPLGEAFLTAVSQIDSDTHREAVLLKVIERRHRNGADLDSAIAAAARLESDYYRARVLERAAARIADGDETTALAWLDSAAAIESDHYLSETLERFLRRRDLSQQVLFRSLAVARAGIGSEHTLGELEEAIGERLRDAPLSAPGADDETTESEAPAESASGDAVEAEAREPQEVDGTDDPA